MLSKLPFNFHVDVLRSNTYISFKLLQAMLLTSLTHLRKDRLFHCCTLVGGGPTKNGLRLRENSLKCCLLLSAPWQINIFISCCLMTRASGAPSPQDALPPAVQTIDLWVSLGHIVKRCLSL